MIWDPMGAEDGPASRAAREGLVGCDRRAVRGEGFVTTSQLGSPIRGLQGSMGDSSTMMIDETESKL